MILSLPGLACPLTVILGALFPLQAYFYAQVVTAFQYRGSKLINRGGFWALMFFILALAVGFAYFAIACVGEYLAEVSIGTSRSHCVKLTE
jgi:ATP-binding cassette subfamily B (MDR/TAP) protein 1